MIIDTPQTKIKQQIADQHPLSVQPVMDELVKQGFAGRWFINSHGFMFGHIWCSDIHVSNMMDRV